jgi:hypothetical protein
MSANISRLCDLPAAWIFSIEPNVSNERSDAQKVNETPGSRVWVPIRHRGTIPNGRCRYQIQSGYMLTVTNRLAQRELEEDAGRVSALRRQRPFAEAMRDIGTKWPGQLFAPTPLALSAKRKRFGPTPAGELVGPDSSGECFLERDDLSSNRHPALSFCLSMIFSENRAPLFRIML